MNRLRFKFTFTKRWIENYFMYFLIFIPFFWPSYFTETGKFELIEFTLTYLSLILMVFEIIRNRIRSDVVLPFIILVAEYVILIVSTYRFQGELITTINTTIKKLCLCLVVTKALDDRDKINSMLHVIRDITIALFVLNIVTEIVYPAGIPGVTTSDLTPHYFLGNVNRVVRVIYPGVFASVILGAKVNRRITRSITLFYIGIIYQSLFCYTSATTMVAFGLITIWIFFSDFIKMHIDVIYTAIITIVAYIEISLVILSSNAFLTNFLTSLFGKTISFSGRTFIWARTIIQIIRNPLWGYGIQNADTLQRQLSNQFSAHNYYLDLIYQRGIIGLIVFLILLIIPLFLLRKKFAISKWSYYLIGFCCALYFMYLFEPFYSTEAIIIPMVYCQLLLLMRESKGIRMEE